MNNALFFMALGGTIPLLVYLFLRYVMHCHYRCPGQMYLLLKVSLFFYLVPVPFKANEIKSILRLVLHNQQLFSLIPDGNYHIVGNKSKMIHIYPNGSFKFPVYSTLFLSILSVWFFIAIIRIIKYFLRYREVRRLISYNSTSLSGEYLQLADTIQQKLSIRRSIRLLTLDDEFPPFTIGIRKPILIIPHNFPLDELYPVLLHEYIHIKNRDFFIRVLCIFVISLHWYLPFSYLLLYEINHMSELNCDNKVTKYMTETEISNYGMMIIEMCSAPSSSIINSSPFISNFKNDSMHLTKERLNMLKNPKCKTSVLLAVISMLSILGSTTVMAGYHVPETIHEIDYIGSTDDEASIDYIISPPEKSSYPEDEENFKQSDIYFIRENGEIYLPDEYSSNIQPRACTHSYIPVTVKKHVPNNSGGCTVYTYNAKQCSKCGALVTLGILSTTTYKICPH